MKNYFFILLFFPSFVFAVNGKNDERRVDNLLIERIREVYYKAVENEDVLENLNKIIVKNFSSDTANYPVRILAYYGAMEALKGKHAFWPFDKLSYLKDAMKTLQRAVNRAPDDLEIRFMRFSILYYVPGILGWNEEYESDLKKVYDLLLQRNYSILDEEIQHGIAKFLIDSDDLTEKEIEKLKDKVVAAAE